MPRTQKVQTVPGQAYGAAQQQAQAQQQIPLPDNATQTPPSMTPSPVQAPGGGEAAPPEEDIMEMLRQLTPTTGLYSPTERPNEPITAGLPFGDGPGPESIAPFFQLRRNAAADTLEALAQFTGDSVLAQLAQVSRQRG